MFTGGKYPLTEMLLHGKRYSEYVFTERKLKQYSDKRCKVRVSAEIGLDMMQ